jgi:hypothetical protein
MHGHGVQPTARSGRPSSVTTRWWLISVAGALAFAGTGCGLSSAPSHQQSAMIAAAEARVRTIAGVPAPLPVRPVTPVARRVAVAAAVRMLAGAVAPPGARAVASLSDRYLDGAAQLPGCNPVEDGTRLWLVPGSGGSLARFLLTHLPAGMRNQVAGGSTASGVPTSYVIVDVPGGNHPQGSLVFTFARIGSDTGLRVDALTVPSGADCASGGGGAIGRPNSPPVPKR